MCTYIVHHDPASNQPLTVATTREDAPGRPTSQPFVWNKPEHFLPYLQKGTLHLSFAPDGNIQRYLDTGILAAQDELRGGSFLGTNKHGVFVAVNNRENNVKFTNRKSRGGIVLDALTFSTAKEAVETLYPLVLETQRQDGRKYPCFNLIVADDKDAYVITNARAHDIATADSTIVKSEEAGDFTVALARIPSRTVSLIGGYDINDFPKSKRTQKFLPMLQQVQPGLAGNILTFPAAGDSASWGSWLSHMVHRTQEGDPFDYSIAQPHPKALDSLGKGDPDWVTIGTHLLAATKTPQGLKYDWLAMDGPPREGRMQAMQVTESGNTPIELFLHGENLSVKSIYQAAQRRRL